MNNQLSIFTQSFPLFRSVSDMGICGETLESDWHFDANQALNQNSKERFDLRREENFYYTNFETPMCIVGMKKEEPGIQGISNEYKTTKEGRGLPA